MSAALEGEVSEDRLRIVEEDRPRLVCLSCGREVEVAPYPWTKPTVINPGDPNCRETMVRRG